MIHVTETAASKITELLAEEQKDGSGLRVFVQGGGCSGFQYGLMIDEGGGSRRPDLREQRREAVRRSDQHPLSRRRRSRLRGHGHGRRLHDQESECGVDLRVRVLVQRLIPKAIAAGGDFPSTRTRRPASCRRQAIQQARSDRQRLPASGRPSQRRRSRRSHQARRSPHQPRHGLPHAAVDGGCRHRAKGGLRRRPFPLRALVPPSAPLPPDLQDLQPVVRVSQLRHRRADRGGRHGAELRGAPERAADLRRVRGLPDRPARDAGQRRDHRAAFCERRAAHRDRHRAQRARVLHPRLGDHARCARPRRLPEAGRRGEGTSRDARSALQASARARPAARIAARRSCSSKARPTGSSPKAPSGSRAASTISRRISSASAANAAPTASSSATARSSRTPKASRSSSSSPRKSVRTSSC